MGGPNGLLTVDDSVKGIFRLLSNLNRDHNGGFFRYGGTLINW